MTATNKIGVGLLLTGCVLTAGFEWLGPAAVIIGLVLVILGLVLALRNRETSQFRDESPGMGGKLYDDD